MKKDVIKRIILEFQEGALPDVLRRDIDIPIDTQKIITVTGPRRSGKTYLLYLLIKELIHRKNIPKERIIYINFDDPRLTPFSAQEVELIIDAYFELYPENRDGINYIFLDEVQNIKDWELGVRRLYDSHRFRIFLTGSSSKLLSKEIATQLRGRAINYEITPFTFKEFLWSRNITPSDKTPYSQQRFIIRKYLDEYLETGGFPEVVLERNRELKIRILREYVETIFFRDLIERYRIKNQVIVRELIRYLATNVGSIFSLNSFYNWLKTLYPITRRTLINYLDYLEDIGLFSFTRKFSYSLKGQAQTLRKCYIIDNGIRYAYGFRFSEDIGKTLENSVFLELKRRKAQNPFFNIFYWRNTKSEIDFVLMENTKVVTLIQVCSNIDDFRTKEREFSSLLKASKEFDCKDLLIITLDYEGEENIKGRNIKILPFWLWAISTNVFNHSSKFC